MVSAITSADPLDVTYLGEATIDKILKAKPELLVTEISVASSRKEYRGFSF